MLLVKFRCDGCGCDSPYQEGGVMGMGSHSFGGGEGVVPPAGWMVGQGVSGFLATAPTPAARLRSMLSSLPPSERSAFRQMIDAADDMMGSSSMPIMTEFTFCPDCLAKCAPLYERIQEEIAAHQQRGMSVEGQAGLEEINVQQMLRDVVPHWEGSGEGGEGADGEEQ